MSPLRRTSDPDDADANFAFLQDLLYRTAYGIAADLLDLSRHKPLGPGRERKDAAASGDATAITAEVFRRLQIDPEGTVSAPEVAVINAAIDDALNKRRPRF
jgi:hypothetical protein